MATLTIHGNTFTPRSPSVSIVGQVNAEQVTFVVDESWSGLELQAQFSNSSIDREPVPVALDETMTCFVPSEATAQPGKVYVALAGYDDGVQIKLTELLHYSNAKTGADPNGGVPPEEQTPSYLNQIKQILNETKEVAKSVRTDADNGLFDGEPGKSPIIKDGNWWIWDVEAQEYRDTGIAASGGGGGTTDYNKLTNRPSIGGVLLEGNKTAQDLGLQPNGDYANRTDIPSKLPAPYTLTFAGAVKATYDGSQAVTVTIPTIAGPTGATPNIQIGTVDTLEPVSDATATITGTPEEPRLNLGIPRGQNGKTPVKGTDYFTEAEIQYVAKQAAALVPGGGSGGELLLAEYIHQGNQEIYFSSFDWASGIGECTKPHGLTEATQAMLVWNDWMTGNVYANAAAMPVEWTSLDQNLFLLPIDDTHVMVVGNDKSTPITVNASDSFNQKIDATKIHFEIPVGFQISDIPELYTKVQLTIFGVVMGNKRYRYIAFISRRKGGGDAWINTNGLLYPPYFGVLTKPRHGLLTSHNITLELNDVGGGSFLYSNYFSGRRNSYVAFPGEEYTEIKRAVQTHEPTSFLGVVRINVDQTCAVWANGTRFRLYGLCKGGEHK